MKRLLTVVLLSVLGMAKAQNYLSLNITEIEQQQVLEYCANSYDSIVFTKETSCNNQVAWGVRDWGTQQIIQEAVDQLTLVPNQMNLTPNSQNIFEIIYHAEGCNIVHRVFNVIFNDSSINEPWSQDYVWKRTGTSTNLSATWGENLSYQWSTGETYQDITVTEPDSYWVRIYNDCGELYDTIEVRDNVEVELATCDLETNLNMVTWPTTPAQAEYVSQVEIKRDGLLVGTAPYTDGQFIDNIGSDAASRTYTVTAIATDGTPCPITSYPKETIHMAYLTGINNTIEVNWNAPTGYDLLGYNICEWNANDGSLTTIDYVGASVTSYTCSESQFDLGYIVIQGVEAGKDGETRLLSNRSLDLVGLGENEATAFRVYPNPAKDRFTIEGTGKLTVTNTLGQTILTKEIDGKATIELPRGMYFVKMNGVTRKIVVE